MPFTRIYLHLDGFPRSLERVGHCCSLVLGHDFIFFALQQQDGRFELVNVEAWRPGMIARSGLRQWSNDAVKIMGL